MQQYIIYLYTFLTIFGFWLALQISKRWKSMIFNTFVLTVLILAAILVIGKIPYDDYMAGNAPINNLLGLSIVALALPLYEQLRQIARQMENYSFNGGYSLFFGDVKWRAFSTSFRLNARNGRYGFT